LIATNETLSTTTSALKGHNHLALGFAQRLDDMLIQEALKGRDQITILPNQNDHEFPRRTMSTGRRLHLSGLLPLYLGGGYI